MERFHEQYSRRGHVSFDGLLLKTRDLLRDYPSLTPADLEAAWEYAAAHPEEIAPAIAENEEGEEGLVA